MYHAGYLYIVTTCTLHIKASALDINILYQCQNVLQYLKIRKLYQTLQKLFVRRCIITNILPYSLTMELKPNK